MRLAQWLIPDRALHWGWRPGLTPSTPNPMLMERKPYVVKGMACWPFGHMTGLTNP